MKNPINRVKVVIFRSSQDLLLLRLQETNRAKHRCMVSTHFSTSHIQVSNCACLFTESNEDSHENFSLNTDVPD